MPVKLLENALASGLAATVASTAASAVVAAAEAKRPMQPLNATNHPVYGDGAVRFRDADDDHTLVGLVTHAAATVFWAMAFETTLVLRPLRNALSLLGLASVGVLAAAVDYTVTSERFTPGWELVLSKTSMAVVCAAMAAAFAGSAWHGCVR